MRPIQHLHALTRDFPGMGGQVDNFRLSRGKDLPEWPSWCFLPMAAWMAIATGGRTPTLSAMMDTARLAAIGTWRYSQGIYRFDEDALGAIAETVPGGDMPAEVLYRLPEWSVYIETPGRGWLGSGLHGYWAHLEWDANTGRHELRLLLDTENGFIPVPLHVGKWTITEALDRAYSEARRQWHKTGLPESILDTEPDAGTAAAELYGLVSLLLYICSDEPEIDDDREPGAHPQRPKPKRTKGGWRLFPAARPRVWAVGSGLGRKLRADTIGEDTGRTVSPHLRRSHWHGYWSGPRDGERRFGYKWLPPTVVAGGRNDE